MLYGSGLRQKLQYASRLAATLAYAIVAQGDKVSLTLFDDQVRAFVPASHSPGQTQRLIEQLDQIEPLHKTRLAECLTEASAALAGENWCLYSATFSPISTPCSAPWNAYGSSGMKWYCFRCCIPTSWNLIFARRSNLSAWNRRAKP